MGGVVAIPAEAVWGLSCDPFNESAVNRLLELKQRSVAKGLIITAASPAFFEPLLAALPASEKAEVMASWPGPHTWLVPNRGLYPPWVTGVSDEVAIRVSGSPSLAATSAIAASPLVSTSANPSGRSPRDMHFK